MSPFQTLAASQPDSSDDTTEQERLVGQKDSPLRAKLAGLASFGSLGALGLEGSWTSAKSAGAAKVEALRQASSRSLHSARSLGGKGVDGWRTAAAAGSAACSSGINKVRSAKDSARERGAEALHAAAAVSGLSLAHDKPSDTPLGRACACCPALTFKQRLAGALACLAIGTLLSLFSLGSVAKLLLGNPLPFALKYTIGNLLSLGASSFLVGPAKQCRDMLAPSRRLASLVYMATLVATLLSVFVFKLVVLALLCILLQALALAWYVLSYIPYGQAGAKKLILKLLAKAGVRSARRNSASAMETAEGD
ncbi:hypothetical protein AB1Y20_011047 [Prymnesium parvum]|uniref:Vesicle transport protein n=1 Tax=Prymnesium parvum TaxID=97485 RepID=A0AB34IMY0_PRYPA